MGDLMKRLEALENRVSKTVDRLAIYQLIATYGPAVDSLAANAGRINLARGREEVHALLGREL